MEDLDHILDDITNPDTGSLHGAVFIAVDKSGNTIYQKASGRTSVDPDGAKPLQINALYWVASMTKLVTAVSVIQLVERGILSLDDDVREKLPELKDIQLLNDMKYGA
ncbi:Beta-lactamase [Aspergillus sclerotialis]|uniref:Beta-lactamase n=1 Tax=Aspergillus sclerotialis TaxID=2070753 RepID=A0A3A2ZEU9_9EURO|nr:Beta-lactamase [Aspergillus sclerotialis]